VNGCTAHSISADNVEALILASVKRFSRFVLKDEEKYSLQGTTQSRYLTGGVPPVRFSM